MNTKSRQTLAHEKFYPTIIKNPERNHLRQNSPFHAQLKKDACEHEVSVLNIMLCHWGFFPRLPTEPCALGSTQPLNISTSKMPGSKSGRCVWLTY
jgi:hypothetical protein